MPLGPLIVAISLLWPQSSTTVSCERLCQEPGLSAQVLAASGCSGTDIASMSQRLLENAEAKTNLHMATDSLARVIDSLSTVEEQLELRRASEDLQSQRATFLAQRVQLINQITRARASLLDSALDDPGESKATALPAAIRNRGHAMPVPLLVTVPGNVDSAKVAPALIAQRRTARLENSVPQRHSAILQAVNTTEATEASQNPSQKLSEVQAALSQILNEE